MLSDWTRTVGSSPNHITQTKYNVPHLTEVESRLHSSVVEFLKRALAVSNFPDEPCENRFFYYCDDLSPAEVMFDDYELYQGDGVNRITLYLAGGFKEEFRDGLVYVVHETSTSGLNNPVQVRPRYTYGFV
jgi:hypothetical protein